MRRAFPWILGALVLGAPAVAWANAGVGFLVIAIPFLVMAFPLAVLVEAPVLARLLRTRLGQALRWSLIANLVSTVLAAGIGIVVDIAVFAPTGSSGATASRTAALASLVPMFFVTWWLEQWMIRRMQPKEAARSPVLATFTANAVSYALLAGTLAWIPSDSLDYPRGDARWRVGEVLAAMSAQKTEVAEFYATQGRFPEPRVVIGAGEGRYLKSLRVEANGRIAAQVHYPGTGELDGKHMVLAPVVVTGGGIVAWDCYSPDMSERANRYLPANCRQGPPRRASPEAGRHPGGEAGKGNP